MAPFCFAATVQTVGMSYVPEQTVLELVEPASVMGTHVLWEYMTEIVGRYHGRAATDVEVADSIRGNPSDDLREPQGLFLLARQHDTPMGCGGLRWLGDHVAEVTRVYVAARARGRGLGTRLMGELERLAGERARTTLRLDTRGDLTEARRLYGHLGYYEISPYNTSSYADHWFEKTLA